MQISQPIIIAALIATMSPATTLFAAQSFVHRFNEESRTYQIAQNMGQSGPGHVGPGPVGPGPMGPGMGGDRGSGAQPGPFGQGPRDSGSGTNAGQQPFEMMRKPGENANFGGAVGNGQGIGAPNVGRTGDHNRRPDEGSQGGSGGMAAPRQPMRSSSEELDKCLREVLGETDYQAMRSGEKQPSDEQKKTVQEKCSSMKRSDPTQGPGPMLGGEAGPSQLPGQGPGMQGSPQGFGGQGSPEGFGGQGSSMQGGPSEEQMAQMEQEQKDRMLKEMQRNLRGMQQGMTMMTKGLRVCTQAKITVDAAVTDGIAKAQSALDRVKNAKSVDEVEDLDFSDFAEIGDLVREQVDLCHRLKELPRITKQLTREVTQMEREVKRAAAQAKRAKIDLADQFNALTTQLSGIRADVSAIGSAKTSEDAEAAMEKLESSHEAMESAREELSAIWSVLNISRGLSEAKREIKNADRQISVFKRQKKDTSEAEALLAEGKTLVSQIEGLAKQKPLDLESLFAAFEQLEDLGNRAEDIFGALGGKPAPRGPMIDPAPSAGLRLDAFEQFRKPESESTESPSQDTGNLDALFGL